MMADNQIKYLTLFWFYALSPVQVLSWRSPVQQLLHVLPVKRGDLTAPGMELHGQ